MSREKIGESRPIIMNGFEFRVKMYADGREKFTEIRTYVLENRKFLNLIVVNDYIHKVVKRIKNMNKIEQLQMVMSGKFNKE
jgi:hypothetical protein